MKTIHDYRNFLKGDLWRDFDALNPDQKKEIPAPPIEKEHSKNEKTITLSSPEEFTKITISLVDAISKRVSSRKFKNEALTLTELSFLLWSTQGIRKRPNFRVVPSAGNRHPFETYLYIQNVIGITPGLYRYLPTEHKLLFIKSDKDFPQKISKACYNQSFVGTAAATFIWTVIPYRTEWRYNIIAHKMVAIDIGHVCQNLYLASTSINAGTCAIGAYYNTEVDSLIGVDGENEFTVYLAPVGKI